jgi:hypothetical protein
MMKTEYLLFVGAMVPSLLILAGAAISMADLTLAALTPETTVAAAADLRTRTSATGNEWPSM